jgi:hypothetical protein
MGAEAKQVKVDTRQAGVLQKLLDAATDAVNQFPGHEIDTELVRIHGEIEELLISVGLIDEPE